MNPLQVLRVAIRALVRNKMRSFLTTLGIIIGVAAVIAMVAIGEGAKAQVEASFASMGSNLLIVLPGSTTAGGQRGGVSGSTDQVVRAIQNPLDERIGRAERNGGNQEQQTNDGRGPSGRCHVAGSPVTIRCKANGLTVRCKVRSVNPRFRVPLGRRGGP